MNASPAVRPATPENTTVSYESGSGRYVTEASEMGWPPGKVPAEIPTAMGNGLPFVFEKEIRMGGETAGWLYKQSAGCLVLAVYND